jgi:hypothetical protein
VAGTTITAGPDRGRRHGRHVAVDNNTVVASTTITASLAVETKFYARSTGLPASRQDQFDIPTRGG